MPEILVHVERGGVVESIHRGDLVVADSSGSIIYSIGDACKFTYWRSSAKPFQVLPLVESGGVEHFGLDNQDLALFTSSHNGEEKHVAGIHSIFTKLGLDTGLLSCGTAPPLSQWASRSLLGKNEPFTALTNPCSGKHAAMLALCLIRGYDTTGYTDPAHPLQLEISDTISDVTGLGPADITLGTDGCGVPVYGLPLLNMALAYARLSLPGDNFSAARRVALRTIAASMIEKPYYVSGTRSLDTTVMEATEGRILAKQGAEGVYCLAVMDKGMGLALKIEDGHHRAIGPVIIEVLRRLGLIRPEELERLKDSRQVKIQNHRKEVIGLIKTAF
ncbi:MAG: asparaginase [Dethiobacter sp.]|jgi:L-asparaginase II|nr:asparaginase [Dethiobacter sp.]